MKIIPLYPMLFSILLTIAAESKGKLESGEISISYNQGTLTSDLAQKNFIGEDYSAFYFDFYGRNEQGLGLGLGIGSWNLKDELAENFEVRDLSSGRTETKSNSATVTTFYLEAGYQYQLGAAGINIHSGYEIAAAERTVGNCIDCPSGEDFKINSGLYIKPRIEWDFTYPDNFGLVGINFTRYLSSQDAIQSVGIILTMRFSNRLLKTGEEKAYEDKSKRRKKRQKNKKSSSNT